VDGGRVVDFVRAMAAIAAAGLAGSYPNNLHSRPAADVGSAGGESAVAGERRGGAQPARSRARWRSSSTIRRAWEHGPFLHAAVHARRGRRIRSIRRIGRTGRVRSPTRSFGSSVSSAPSRACAASSASCLIPACVGWLDRVFAGMVKAGIAGEPEARARTDRAELGRHAGDDHSHSGDRPEIRPAMAQVSAATMENSISAREEERRRVGRPTWRTR